MCMLGMVLVNLLFVQLTDAGRLAWLVPLYLFTVFSPALGSLRGRTGYRYTWNLVVIGLFCGLLRHAAGYDLQYVLQDGLMLAVLCQVHLLNNLGDDQRPDLLFLNSFLIALATGYLCQDLTYAVAFLAYVPMFLIGLQLLSVTRDGHELEPNVTRRIVVDGLKRSGVLVTISILVFLFWPRDFNRQSLLFDEFDFASSGDGAEIGFSEKLELKRRKVSGDSDRIVMTAKLRRGNFASAPQLWRGAALDSTDGRSWWSSEGDDFLNTVNDEEWLQEGPELVRANPDEDIDMAFSVKLFDLEAARLFVPLEAQRITPQRGIHADRVRPDSEGALHYGDRSEARVAAQFELTISSRPHGLEGPAPETIDARVARYVALPQAERLKEARRLAESIVSELPEDSEQHEIVAALRYYLEEEYTYLAPGSEGSAQSLDEFLEGESGGHCELFASALATMLRSLTIPCRVVTGFRAVEWDPSGTQLTIRERGAHAWVEVLDPLGGWYTVDPNPSSALEAQPGLMARARTAFADLWAQLASFDSDRRSSVLAWAKELPVRSARWARAHPLRTLAIAGALCLLLFTRRWMRRRKTPAVLREYQSALRRAGVVRGPEETPRELLARARTLEVEPRSLAALERATDAHERDRYAALTPGSR